MSTDNLQALVTTKAALDLGLVTADDYDAVKSAFLQAQQLRAAMDTGLISAEDFEANKATYLAGLSINHTTSAATLPTSAPAAPAPVPAAASNGVARTVSPRLPAAVAAAVAAPIAAVAAAVSRPQAPLPSPSLPPAPAPPAPPSASPTAIPTDIPKLGGAKAFNSGVSMSGIGVSEDSVNLFYLIRGKSTHKWAHWKVDDEGKTVVIAAVGGPQSTYSEFLAALPQDDCRYGCEYQPTDFICCITQHPPLLIIYFYKFLFSPQSIKKFTNLFLSTAVFDYKFNSPDGHVLSKLIFINWAPDTARVKAKMMYASTKDFFRSQLDGISAEFQASDLDDIFEDTVEETVQALKR